MITQKKQRTQNKPKACLMGLKYKGVSIRASIRDRGKLIFLGVYETAEDAARAYDEAAKRLHGDDAVTNESLGLLDQETQSCS
jgi:hypothetical protein